MSISLLDGSLEVNIYYEKNDQHYEDNVCICIKEKCPEDEKILYAGETNLFITPEDARLLAEMLNEAAELSSHGSR